MGALWLPCWARRCASSFLVAASPRLFLACFLRPPCCLLVSFWRPWAPFWFLFGSILGPFCLPCWARRRRDSSFLVAASPPFCLASFLCPPGCLLVPFGAFRLPLGVPWAPGFASHLSVVSLPVEVSYRIARATDHLYLYRVFRSRLRGGWQMRSAARGGWQMGCRRPYWRGVLAPVLARCVVASRPIFPRGRGGKSLHIYAIAIRHLRFRRLLSVLYCFEYESCKL